MREKLKIAFAFIGIIVGAGFASGQEILMYFTSFGYVGMLGIVVSTALFAYLGMALMKIGSTLKTTSHKEAIYLIGGRWVGLIIDIVIIITLFGVGVVMVAGAGSIVQQQFGWPPFLGSLIMILLVFFTLLTEVDRVITIIGSITPFLLILVVIASIYSLMTMDLSFGALHPIAIEQESALNHWFISAVNYVSFNIAVGAGMSLVMGGVQKDSKLAAQGGFLGGIGIGVLSLFAHLAIFSRIDTAASADMPMLFLVNEITPILGYIMSIVLFGMIFSTAISMFYAFIARFFQVEEKRPIVAIVITCLIGFIASFVGFKDLISKLYPMIGFGGLILITTLIYASLTIHKFDK